MEPLTASYPSRPRGRPRKSETPLPDARGRLVREGVAVLTERGYSAVGIEEILTVAGISKGSFYHYFEGKAEFALALIDAYAAYFARKLDRWFLDDSLSPLDRIRCFVDDASAGMQRFEFRRGCLVGNLGQEISALPPAFRERLASVFADWEMRTARCLKLAKLAGEIDSSIDCAASANFFWIGWEGAVLRAKLERNREPLTTFALMFLAGLEPKR